MSDNQIMEINSESIEYKDAYALHTQILVSGTMAAQSLVEMCRGLKSMRDKQAFIHLGYRSFDDYVEKAANMKSRQAYNYIRSYERLGPEVLQSNATLGITKLELLAQLPESTRAEVLEAGEVEEMSTREVKDLVAELTKAREQLSLLQDESDEIKQTKVVESADLKETIKALERQLRDSKRDVELEADRQASEKIRKASQKAEKKAEAARVEGYEAGKSAYASSLEEVEAEKTEALKRQHELESKLSVAGNSDSSIIAYLFEEIQTVYARMLSVIERIDDADPEAAGKFRGALQQYIKRMDAQLLPSQEV